MNVKVLSIKNQFMRQFLQNIEGFFPNLETIIAENVQMEEVSGEILANFPNLRQVAFNQNSIETIGRGLFAANQKILAINLSLNPIRHIAQNTFESLPDLRWLEMVNTTCVNLNIVNDRNLLLNSVFQISQNCPASSEMIEEDILSSDAFQERVEEIARVEVNNGLKPIETSVTSLKEVLEKLSNKVDEKFEDIVKIKKDLTIIFEQLDLIEERLKQLETDDSGSGSGDGSGLFP